MPLELKSFPLKGFNDLHEGSTVSPENPSSSPLPPRIERGEENGGRTRGRARREEEVGT